MEPELKRCAKCGEWKLTTEFYKVKAMPQPKLHSWCKICVRKDAQYWRKENPEKVKNAIRRWKLNNLERSLEIVRQWRLNNLEKSRGGSKCWRLKNLEKHNIINKRWQMKHPEQWKKIQHAAYKKTCSTPKGVLDKRMSCMIWHSLRGNKAGRHWESLVGYGVDELRAHLESLFTGSMTWDAFMRGKIHVDHIAPKSGFKYDSPEDKEFKVCWSLANLQPMWAKDNLSKHTKTMEEWERIKNGKQ